MHYLYYLYLLSFSIIAYYFPYYNNSNYNNLQTKQKFSLYNNFTTFYISNSTPESQTFIILSPKCTFNGNYNKHDCKSYLNMFLDMNCTLYQQKYVPDPNGNPDFYLYISPKIYYKYDSRVDIYNQTNYTWINLAQGLYCQNNNVCIFTIGFTLSYKKWKNVPTYGNNVTLNCTKFNVYAIV